MSESKRQRRLRTPENARRGLRPLLVLAVLVALAVVLTPTGSAKPPASAIKLYQVCLAAGDGTVPCTSWDSSGGAVSALAGSHAEMQVTIHNDKTSNQTLGSANLTVPAGLGLTIDTAGSSSATGYSTYASTSTSTTLQLRNLNLSANGQATVAFYVNSSSTTCGEGTWGIQVKQSNDFNGAGNDFSPPTASSGLTSLITSGCHLAWIDQPASANQSVPITDTPFTPSGTNVHNVTVAIEDASNNVLNLNTGTATLAVNGSFDACGTGCNPQFTGTSATFQGGIATFSTFQSAYTGTGFTATASALGLSTGPSSPSFVIQQNGTDCLGQDPCLLNTTINNSPVTISGSGGNFIYIALGASQLDPSVYAAGGGCANFKGTGTSFAETNARNGDGTIDITISIANSALKKTYGPNYGQPNVPICAGVKRLDANHNPVDCTADQLLGGWADRTLASNGTFNGGYSTAVCGAGGYWWGILGTFQDPNPPFDSTQIPLITAWGSSPDGVYRTFTVHEPGASLFAPYGWDGHFGA
jgi:hypothetical protein